MTPGPSDNPASAGATDAAGPEPDLGRAIAAALLSAAQDAVVVVDDRGLVRLWNQTAERLFGYSAEEAAGRPVHDLIAPAEQRSPARSAFGHFAAEGQGPAIGRTVPLDAVDRGGRPVSIELSLSSVELAGRWYGIGIARDIREHLRREAEIKRARDWMERVFDAAGSLILIRDPGGRVRDINESGCRILGLDFEAVVARHWIHDFIPADAGCGAEQHFQSLVSGERAAITQQACPLRCHDGVRPFLWNHQVLLDVAGRVEAVVSAGLDMSDYQRMADALRDSERNFHNVVEMNRSGILILDEDGNIRFCNAAAEILLDRRGADLLGVALGVPAINQVTEMQIRRPGGAAGVAEMSATETEWQGAPAFLLMLHDITDRKRAEERASFLALHDGLTGLPNRRAFTERLAHTLERVGAGAGLVALLYMDLNRFKLINDTLGHDVGDAFLCAFADRLKACLRATDAVARLGGDEFAVLVEGISRLADVEAVLAKLKACLASPVMLGGETLPLSTSIGIAVCPDDGQEAEALMRLADQAMYAAKRGATSNFRFYSTALDRGDESRLELGRLLEGVVERGELHLAYQPEVSLRDGSLVGMEALLRWSSPELGDVIPERFVRILEATGQIGPVGAWVIDRVCAQIAAWRREGLRPVPVSVNVSPRQLGDGSLHQVLARSMARWSVPPGLLVLELTESAIAGDHDAAAESLGRLERIGVSLHLDDFGTGESSLGVLRRLPFGAVKIDRGFIAGIAAAEDDAMLVTGIVGMAHSLRKVVVAEGVETEAQAGLLRGIDCDRAQGWLFGRPVAAQEIALRLARQDD